MLEYLWTVAINSWLECGKGTCSEVWQGIEGQARFLSFGLFKTMIKLTDGLLWIGNLRFFRLAERPFSYKPVKCRQYYRPSVPATRRRRKGFSFQLRRAAARSSSSRTGWRCSRRPWLRWCSWRSTTGRGAGTLTASCRLSCVKTRGSAQGGHFWRRPVYFWKKPEVIMATN